MDTKPKRKRNRGRRGGKRRGKRARLARQLAALYTRRQKCAASGERQRVAILEAEIADLMDAIRLHAPKAEWEAIQTEAQHLARQRWVAARGGPTEKRGEILTAQRSKRESEAIPVALS